MIGISDIRICGLDDRRPPRITKQPYIDLSFKLSHKAPEDWCRRFNDLVANDPYKPKIDPKEGLYIDAWVRAPGEIPPMLAHLNKKVDQCTTVHIEAIEAARRRSEGASASEGPSPEQEELNRVIASLQFDAPDTA